jgi:ligand-binding sensor domain-containing protein
MPLRMGWSSVIRIIAALANYARPLIEFASGAMRCGGRKRVAVACLTVAIIAASSLSAADAPMPSSEWVARAWQTEDGLPQNTVNAIVQTRDGFLWVGTNGGLARFDGVRFRKFGLQDGLRSVEVMALAEDSAGALWIGTSGGGLSRWQGERLASFGAAEGFPPGTDVIALAADRDGSLWIGTDKGLVHWSGGTFEIIDESQGLPKKQVRALLQDSRGTLWVSSIGEGLFRGVDNRFVRVPGPGPVDGNVYSLLEDRGGAVWAGTDYGVLWKRHEDAWRRFDSASGLPKANIESLAQGADGTLWIGIRNSGLYRSSGERFAPAASAGDLSEVGVRALAVDREGSVWAGAASAGLHRLSPRVLNYWSRAAGLPPTAVKSVAEDASGSFWIGTASKGVYRFDAGRFSKLEDPAVPGTPYVYCTAVTSDGAVWAAGEQCLFRFQAGQPTRSFLDAPVKGEAIRALCADGDTLWLGTYYSSLLKCDANGVQVVAPRGSFPGGITSIVSVPGGALWVGTSEGLHRWEHGTVQT